MTVRVVTGLIEDLRAEALTLISLLEPLPLLSWSVDTPSPGWTVRDQVAHLAHFDYVTRLSVGEQQSFTALRDGVADLQMYVDSIGAANAHRTGSEILAWWREENQLLREAMVVADPATRVPWFGPSMSLASKVTARIMEVWAHGQDVVDALGLERPATERLRHVANIGVRAFPNSFRTSGLDVPEQSVSVSLTAPDGASTWTWGSPGAANQVSGPAQDFCLVVTQRRHITDTELSVSGDVAAVWMTVAQAFAGPPGAGRQPGQFRR
ncbi:TIGR03084 family metal-binding protein [Paenarthrobacter ureafaciens]